MQLSREPPLQPCDTSRLFHDTLLFPGSCGSNAVCGRRVRWPPCVTTASAHGREGASAKCGRRGLVERSIVRSRGRDPAAIVSQPSNVRVDFIELSPVTLEGRGGFGGVRARNVLGGPATN